jgi:hypothetical protein
MSSFFAHENKKNIDDKAAKNFNDVFVPQCCHFESNKYQVQIVTS